MRGDYQNNIDSLPRLSDYRMENLFKVYNIDGYYFYNLIGTLTFDEGMDDNYYYEWAVKKPTPWTIISHTHYQTIHLWWIICAFNNIQNPINFPEPGTKLKILRPQYIREILDKILSRINEQ